MGWFKKKTESEGEAVASIPAGAVTATEADKALDTVATFLRVYGKYAFDTDETEAEAVREECEQWASKILVGAAHSEEEDDDSEEAAPDSSRVLKRDWGGVRQFLNARRKMEGDYVGRSLGNLRQTIQTFAQCLTATVGADRESDARVEQGLDALTTALSDNDTQRIREQAASVVGTVREVIAERRKREAKQVWTLGERLRELKSELSEAREQAATDALTKLYNRAAFDRQLERLAALGLLFGHAPVLILTDIDHFKQTNDTHGHPAGDAVLQATADSLTRAFLRREDFVARYGGEEFAVLVVDTDEMGVELLCERWIESVRKLTVQHGGSEIEVRVSAGVCPLVPGESAAEWLARADQALYRAKQEGRDRLVYA